MEERTPENAMSLAVESRQLLKNNKELAKENKRLNELNDFWRKPALFSPPAVRGLQKRKNEIHHLENK